MTISSDTEAQILRYFHVEKWRVGTIAAQLSVHHTTVKRVLSQTGVPKAKLLQQASMIDDVFRFSIELRNEKKDLVDSYGSFAWRNK